MKKIFLLIILIIFSLPAFGVTFDAYYPDEEKLNKPLYIRGGTFIRVVNVRDINSFTADIGDECEFLNKYDMFIDEHLVIPRNSKVYGVIEDVREPVQGTNGAIKIKIDRIVTPYGDKTFYPDAHIYTTSDNYIGGEQTNPAYYKKTPHYIDGWGYGILQLTPINIYEQGKHAEIKPGAELLIIFHKDLKIN